MSAPAPAPAPAPASSASDRRLSRRQQLLELNALLIVAGVIGVMGATSAVGFRWAISQVQWLLTQHKGGLVETAKSLPPWIRCIVPVVGGVLAGLALMCGQRLTRGASSTDYMEAIVVGDGRIRTRSTLFKSISSLFSVASGGSIGREGSMVHLSAYIASVTAIWLKVGIQRRQMLVACGAAAGIAAVYNAPLAAVLFVAEIVLHSMAVEDLGPLIVASVAASATMRYFRGPADLPLYGALSFSLGSSDELVTYVILGLLAGIMAPLYQALLEGCKRQFARLEVPLAVKLGLGGLAVGLISMIEPEVWGNGYSSVRSLLGAPLVTDSVFMVLICKVFATALTTGSGAVGGVFTPTLFTGAALGGLCGLAWHGVWPALSANAYAVVGMGAFLAAVTHAPFTAILMAFEMTSDYRILLPLMLASATAVAMARWLDPRSIYEIAHRPTNGAPDPRAGGAQGNPGLQQTGIGAVAGEGGPGPEASSAGTQMPVADAEPDR